MFDLLPIVGLACFLASPVEPAPAPQKAVEQTEPAAPEAVRRAGLRVVRDPVTGRIVSEPTDAELAELPDLVLDQARRSAWELREFSLPNGGHGVYLDGWADHSLAVEVTAEGEFREVCTQGDRHLKTKGRSEASDR
jgi:hypothetical protein